MKHTPTAPPLQSDSADNAHELIPVLTQAEHHGLATAGSAGRLQCELALGVVPPADVAGRVNALLAAGPAATRALDAIAPVFRPDDVIELRAFRQAGGSAGQINGRLDDPTERAAMKAFIQKHNAVNNLYYGIQPRVAEFAGTDRPASAPHVAAVPRRVAVFDLDMHEAPDVDPDWSQTVAAIRDVTDVLAVFDTGNGVHVVLPLADDGKDVAASVAPLKDVMARLGADNLADAPRVARLPFTVNLPTASKRERGNVPVVATLRHGADGGSVSYGPLTVADLCAALEGVADRLGLPGKHNAGAAPGVVATPSSAVKTGWPAPSAAVLRMAVEALPNDGPFDDRDDFLRVVAAVKGAAVAGGFEADGRDAAMEWGARWHFGGDPAETERVWDTMGATHSGWGALMRMLEQSNPAGHVQVKAAAAAADYANAAAANVAAMGDADLTRYAQGGGVAQLPPRKWLYGKNVIAGYLSMIVAPGGTGKSALAMVEAIAMASGRPLLGDQPHRPLRVLYHNEEDDREEALRRLHGAMKHHAVTEKEIGGRLFLTSGRDMPMMLARQGRDGLEIVPGAMEKLTTWIKENRIDVVILDPLAALHTLPENSNEAANTLMGALRKVAHETGAAIVLVHHTGKGAATDMQGAGAGASRGASAFVDAARNVRQLGRMAAGDAKKLGIGENDRWRYIRVDNGKANLAPVQNATWLHLASVALGNGTRDYPAGDNVQTVEPWTPPAVAVGHAVGDADIMAVQEALNGAGPDRRIEAKNSPRGWIGFLVAEALNVDVGPMGATNDSLTPQQLFARQEMATLIQSGVTDGWLVQTQEKGADRHDRKCIAVGRVRVEAGDADADVEATDADVDADGAR
ncbi:MULTISPECIES: AAA family ATPase [unclassified Yoonia]|uniref:AAA family ATPase n=1 Tax=unclassified Yoonia TaxID=2629118 RepID=UPI002AFF14BB|nr:MULTISPECIES: AAA family ATPase [unclassified Yoonia]